MAIVEAKKLFQQLNGNEMSGSASFHSDVHHSQEGTLYLTNPGVIVIAQPRVNMVGLANFLAGFDHALNFPEYLLDPTKLPDGAQLCKFAGQFCDMSFGPSRTFNIQAEKYFNNIRSSGHGSVLEHANFSLLLYGVSRSITHELVRHRAGFGFSQVSQRFVSGKVLRFVERPEYCQDLQLHAQFLQRIDRIAREYATLISQLMEMQQADSSILSAEVRTDLRKKVQQCARSLLPNETEAPIVITGNARAWRHFIETRATQHAEVEMRELVIRIFLCLLYTDSILFSDYTMEQLSDGTYEVKTKFKKI